MDLESDEKLFTTKTSCKPKMVIDEIRVLCQFALLRDSIVNKLEAALARKALNIPFFMYVQKSFAIEVGRLESTINVSLRDGNFDTLIVFLHTNSNLLGTYDSNYQKLENHGVTNAFLQGPLGLKYPVLIGK